MSSKTKIVVLHMKEIIYTAVFVALGIILIILLTVFLLCDKIIITTYKEDELCAAPQ